MNGEIGGGEEPVLWRAGSWLTRRELMLAAQTVAARMPRHNIDTPTL